MEFAAHASIILTRHEGVKAPKCRAYRETPNLVRLLSTKPMGLLTGSCVALE